MKNLNGVFFAFLTYLGSLSAAFCQQHPIELEKGLRVVGKGDHFYHRASFLGMGTIVVEKNGIQKPFCMGTIVHPEYVLTSVDCLPNEQWKNAKFYIQMPNDFFVSKINFLEQKNLFSMSRKTEGQFFFESKLLSVHQSSYSSISMILFRLERKFELTSLPDDFFRSSEIYFPPTLEDTRSNFLPMADSSLWHLDQNREIDIFPPVLVVGYHQQQYYVQRCQLSAIQTYPDIDLDCGEISQQFLPGAIVIAHTSKMFHILGIQKSAQRGQYVHLQLLDFFASMPSFPKEKKALMMEWSVLSSGVPSLDSFQLFFVS